MQVQYRSIKSEDNAALAALIRGVLEEFGAARPGTVYTDPTTDALYSLFQQPLAMYCVAESEGKLLGGCGLFPTEGLPEGCTELVKLYLLPEARGKGIGKTLMERCIAQAREWGYVQLYLETLNELDIAVSLYERMGFAYLKGPLGNTGHFACEIRMLKQLSPADSTT